MLAPEELPINFRFSLEISYGDHITSYYYTYADPFQILFRDFLGMAVEDEIRADPRELFQILFRDFSLFSCLYMYMTDETVYSFRFSLEISREFSRLMVGDGRGE